MIALREAQNCGGCHNPGRSQRPVMERRCTLDCQGCHIDPAGAGPRNAWGKYYAFDQASLVNLFKVQDPLKDTSRFDIHYDGRYVAVQDITGKKTFPMSSEASLRVRPFVNFLHITWQSLLLGRVGDNNFRILHEGTRAYRERWSVMVDSLPFNTYVRAYRGQPMYGLRRPNHTAWIRERIGLGQFATTEAVEVGGTPNVPFFRVAKMSGDPYAPAEERQRGTSWHGGVRGVTAGWHLNGSGWDTSSDTHAIKMKAFGGGFNILQLLAYGERNWRDVKTIDGLPDTEAAPTQVHPSSTISEYSLAYAGIPGIMFGSMWEKLRDAERNSQRTSLFVDVHPVPFVQFEVWQRRETGSRTYADWISMVHLYADF